MKSALIIFAKNPQLGKVKTRLAATIGDEKALAIYNQLLSHTEAIASKVNYDKYVFYSNYVDQDDLWNNDLFFKELQNGINLGDRMTNAFRTIFGKGHHRIVIIGTDCPEISTANIESAFQSLDENEIVIGPAHDGGYYLIGMKQEHRSLFENISWSTATVLWETLAKCKSLNLNYQLLPTLRDIDREDDLKYLNFKL